MKTLLIVGVETVVGANLAASWSERGRVIGLSTGPDVGIPGCETAAFECNTAADARAALQEAQPEHVIYCGAAARSAWEAPAKTCSDATAETWAAAAAQEGSHFTLISSDAIFTGPWMFHDEESSALCRSAEAQAIREMENRIRQVCPRSLIVRTNAFGWSPLGADGGWVESVLSALENGQSPDCDPISHGTPILASDLADYLEAALEDDLTGVFHIAGAERVSPHQFVRQLSNAFDIPSPAWQSLRELSSRPTGFGRGETSLQSRRFRNEYDCTMPLLGEGIERLLEQHRTGYRERLCGEAVASEKAA